ncbi:MAG TPA: hypothetical protein VKX34_09365 [Aequorivita sp.]|nr:hypothetical protein [Aequorivita sp.]
MKYIKLVLAIPENNQVEPLLQLLSFRYYQNSFFDLVPILTLYFLGS